MKGKKNKAIVSLLMAGFMFVNIPAAAFAQTTTGIPPSQLVLREEAVANDEKTEILQTAEMNGINLVEVTNPADVSGWISHDAVIKIKINTQQKVDKVWFTVATGEQTKAPQEEILSEEGQQEPAAEEEPESGEPATSASQFTPDNATLLYDGAQAAAAVQETNLEIPVDQQSQDWTGTVVTIYIIFADGRTETQDIPVYIDKAVPAEPEVLEATPTESGTNILFATPLKQASGSVLYASEAMEGDFQPAFNENQPKVFEVDPGETIYLKSVSGAGLESEIVQYTAPQISSTAQETPSQASALASLPAPEASSVASSQPEETPASTPNILPATQTGELPSDEHVISNFAAASSPEPEQVSKIADGHIIFESGAYYFVYPDGTKALNKIVWLHDGARVFDSQGKMRLGWYTLDGKLLYANPASGLLYYDTMLLMDGAYYYFDKECAAAVSTVKSFSDGNRVYDDAGRMRLGWYKLGDILYYANPNSGILCQDEMQNIGGYYYYFNKDGATAVSTVMDFADGSRIYDATGKMQVGWFTLNGEHYYADPNSGILLKKRMLFHEGYYYYFKDNGAAARSQIVNFADGNRIYDDAGRMRLKWHEMNGKLYYSDPNSGILYQDTMLQLDGFYYYFNPDGSAARSEVKGFADGNRVYDEKGRMQLGWHWLNGNLYFANPNSGILYQDSMQVIGGYYFYFDKECAAAVSTIVDFADGSRIYDEAGRMHLGWYTLGGNRYYANPNSGVLFRDSTQVIDGKYYFFGPDGVAATSMLVESADGARIYDAQGQMLKGMNWVKGKLYYANPDTGLLAYKVMQVIDGYYYYFGEDYAAATGVVHFADGPRVYDSQCRMVIGWYEIAGNLYYADPVKGGVLAGPGGFQINGKWYQFQGDYSATRNKIVEQDVGKAVIYGLDGSLQFGLYELNGKLYYAGEDGLLKTGWVTVPGKGQQYYFGSDYAFTGQTKMDITRGIDVSAHQGAIDWAAVAASGQVDFAIIRALTWSSTVKYYVIDPYFDYNVRQAKAHGLKVGVYLFTYAFNNAEMQEEINYFVNSSIVKNLKRDGIAFELPVFIDYEYEKALQVTSYQQRTDMLRHGMVLLEQAGGYKPGFYSSLSWANNHYNARQLEADGYPFWLANYGKYHAQDKPVTEHNWGNLPPYLWQYTSKGRIPGINTDVDLNYLYGTYGSGGGVVPPLPKPEDYTIAVYDQNTKQTVTDTLETILQKIVAAEMGTGQPMEAYKAQAVAAHSWLRYQFENGNSLPQVALSSNVSNDIKTAVAAVKKEIASYNGKPALTMYGASSSGVTNSAQSFFQLNGFPYLASVSDPGGTVPRYMNKATTIGRNSYNGLANTGMEYAIGKMLGRPPTGDPSTWIGGIYKDAYGYINGVTVCGTWVSASTFYDNLFGLFSPNISSMTYNAQNQSWTFVTNGNGHCLGMSQTGAIALARNGWDYKAILNYYFQGISYQSSEI